MSNMIEAPKIEEFTNVLKGPTGFVRENYLSSFKLPISLWEDNLKFLNTQVEQWVNFQQNYINAVIKFYDELPSRDANSEDTNGHFKYPLALQKSYIDSVRSTLDSFTKKNLDLIQKNIEKTSSLFDSYLNLFRAK